MDEETIDYQELFLAALLEVPRRVLQQVAKFGPPGEHHFYLTFRTAAPGVDIPRFLRDQYPEEMTIILQHQFWDLEVDAERFSVDLRFGGKRVKMTIPFSALVQFADPAAAFGLRFDAVPIAAVEAPSSAGEPAAAKKPAADANRGAQPGASSPSEVLRFDPSRRR